MTSGCWSPTPSPSDVRPVPAAHPGRVETPHRTRTGRLRRHPILHACSRSGSNRSCGIRSTIPVTVALDAAPPSPATTGRSCGASDGVCVDGYTGELTVTRQPRRHGGETIRGFMIVDFSTMSARSADRAWSNKISTAATAEPTGRSLRTT
ncbi:MAG: hypothetical protein R2695_04205 [Acidimicrobiales bacterium]